MKTPTQDLLENFADHLPDTYSNEAYRDSGNASSHASASPISRAVVLEYRDEDLPPYEDAPLLATQSQLRRGWNQPPPDLPSSQRDANTLHTLCPDYSTDAESLQQMIYDQSSYPPTYYVEMRGTHTETTYRVRQNTHNHNSTRTETTYHPRRHSHNNNLVNGEDLEVKTDTITDFFIRINITNLLPGPGVGGQLKFLADDEKGYRGGIIKRLTPSIGSPEIQNQHDELKAWCDRYVADPSTLKSFILKREIINHDTKKIESFLRSLVASTNYRGNVTVSFPVTDKYVKVYSPGRINTLRHNPWVYWTFYLTFLWTLSWPFLLLSTAKYQVVKILFPYADETPEAALRGVERTATVLSEASWFHMWEKAIRRGVLGRMNCQNIEMDDEYRLNADAIEAREPRLDSGDTYFVVGSQFPGHRQPDVWGYDHGIAGENQYQYR